MQNERENMDMRVKKVNEVPVEIIRLEDHFIMPKYATDGSAGLDLFATRDAVIEPGETDLIPVGFKMNILDPTWVAMIYPRSSLGHKRGLVLGNSTGVIDSDYQGEIFVSLTNRNFGPHGDPHSQFIYQGDRIAQMVFLPFGRASFTPVDEFPVKTERAEGGFGSTGK